MMRGLLAMHEEKGRRVPDPFVILRKCERWWDNCSVIYFDVLAYIIW